MNKKEKEELVKNGEVDGGGKYIFYYIHFKDMFHFITLMYNLFNQKLNGMKPFHLL